jgi:exodeoxyribonuclease V gamma subunit
VLFVHRSERADLLVSMLAELLRVPARDPMAQEVVAVPTRGIERWLTQQLSHTLGAGPGRRDGICANVDFPFPGTLVSSALAAGSGIEEESDPWAADRSVWPLLEAIGGSLDEPWLVPLAAHLRNAAPEGERRSYASARHIADLFDRYAVHRPEMVLEWARGRDGGVPADGVWQAFLWRRLRERIGTPSPAERLSGACERLGSGERVAGLPDRFSAFGLTSLPTSYVDVLVALGAAHDVHLFLLHPSPVLWAGIARSEVRPGRKRREDRTASEVRNPLLASWGRDSREMQLVLMSSGGEWTDSHAGIEASKNSLLARLQADVRADSPPLGAPLPAVEDSRPVLGEGDASIQVHSCHGRARQVEVLRHAILHLFCEHEDLEPRDVLVMCPDIETYAPLIHAAFDVEPDPESEAGQRADLRVRLADRAIRQVNPILGAVSKLVEMVGGRMTATDVLDLAACEPVRRKFGFDEDDRSRLEGWVVSSGIRWGLDSEYRGQFQLGGLASNTWRSGLDRILLGVPMAEERQRMFRGVLPLDDMSSGDIELAGRLAEFVDRIDGAAEALRGPQPIEGWTKSIASSVDALMSVSERHEWQQAQLTRILADLVDEATTGESVCGVELSLGDVRSLLEDRLKGRPTRANFRTGHLTVCTLVPMRSVPHRVVCLLGLDDGEFPRNVERDGDDLILADPNVGDHDARSEDRQLVLDALLAAEDHLVITYTGRDERSNLVRPPAVPVGELLDVIDSTVRTPDGSPARTRVVVQHPLQPFDKRNFLRDELTDGVVWSFDGANLDGAVAAQRRSASGAPGFTFLRSRLEPVDCSQVDLRDLDQFLRAPVRSFLRRRMDLNLSDRAEEIDDSLPVELDQLGQWGVADRMLVAMLDGAGLDPCLAAERARGELPPGALADSILEDIVSNLESLVDAGSDSRPAETVSVNITLPSGTTVLGTVPSVKEHTVHRVVYARLGAQHRLTAWLHLLAVTAARPDQDFESITVGRGASGLEGPAISISEISGLGGRGASVPDAADAAAFRRGAAVAYLDRIVDLYSRAMCEPPPLYCKTSGAWAEAVLRDGRPEQAAVKQWTSNQGFGESFDADNRLVLGGIAPFDALLREVPRPDESGEGWDGGQPTRFGRWALRLWGGLLAHEKVTRR